VHLVVLDTGNMLHDAFAVRRPGIDAEGEVAFFILSQSGERPER
jgi:hypothetical protein